MDSKIKKYVIPLIIGIFLFVLTLYFIGIGKIFQNLANLNIYLYLAALGCIFISLLLWTFRWKIFIKANGYDVPLFGLLKNLIVGLGFNNLTPLAKFGGEPVRAYLLKEEYGIKMREGFATVMAELTVFFIVNISLIMLSILLISIKMDPPLWLYFILIPFGVLVSLILFGILEVYSGRDIIIRIIKWFSEKIKRLEPYEKKLSQTYKGFQRTFRESLQKRAAFGKALACTLLFELSVFLKFFILFLALDHPVSPVKIIIAMGISAVLLALPTTPGSLGVYEGGFASVLIFLGIETGAAGAVVFLDRLVWYWGITIVGGIFGVYYGMNIFGSESRERLKEDLKGK